MMTMDNYNKPSNWKNAIRKAFGQVQSDESSLESSQEIYSAGNLNPEEKEYQGSVTSYPFLSQSSSINSNNISKDCCNESSSFHDLISEKTSCELITNKAQDVRNSTKQKRNFSERDINNQVPEWNTVFKSIIGKKSSALENQKTTFNAMKEQENLQKHVSSVHPLSTSRTKINKVPKPRDPEEEKVIELFARSRMFTVERHYLNEFDGAGVDIFKRDKKSTSDTEFADKAWKYEPDYPLVGFVAPSKPYVRSPDILFDESPWDDDLLF